MSDYYAHLDVGPILEANKELQARVESLEQENRELRQYAQHHRDCHMTPAFADIYSRVCSCGLSEALARNEEHPKMGVHRCPKCKKMIPDGEECHHCNNEQPE